MKQRIAGFNFLNWDQSESVGAVNTVSPDPHIVKSTQYFVQNLI